MADREVMREIEKNQERERAHEEAAEDDGPIIDTAERLISPITDAIASAGDESDREDVRRRRHANDADQRGAR